MLKAHMGSQEKLLGKSHKGIYMPSSVAEFMTEFTGFY